MVARCPRFELSTGLLAEWHLSLPDLVCQGVRLREPGPWDAELLAAEFGPQAAASLGVAAPGARDEWMNFVVRVRTGRAARQTVCYIVTPDGSTSVGGLVLLQRLAPGSRAAAASFLLPEAHRATGMLAASAGCMLAFAFQAVGVGRVEGRAGSSRELEAVRRLGAVTEGVLRQSQPVRGGFADQVLWAVLATEWNQPFDSAPSVLVRAEPEHPFEAGPTGAEDVEPPAWTRRLPTLDGSMVTLREIEPLDVPALLEALDSSDIEVAFEPAPSTPDELRRYISWVRSQRSKGRAAGFAIVPRDASRAAGLLQVGRVEFVAGVAEWGIVLARSHRGTGAATEAARLMAGFAFETLGVHRLETRASGISPGSISLLRRLGAVREAHLRESFALGSEVVDDDLWAILKSDWHGRRTVPGLRIGYPTPACAR